MQQAPQRIQLRTYVAERYLARIAGLSPNAKSRYKSQLKIHILPSLGGVVIDRIDAKRVQAFIAELLKTRLAPSSVSSVGRLLLRILTVADGEGFITAQVDARRILWPRTQSAPIESRFFTQEETDRILEAATGWSRIVFCLLAWAGLRIGEALGLDWANVDFSRGVLMIRQQASRQQLRTLKSHTSRADLPMDPRLHQVLIAQWEVQRCPTHGLVFHRFDAALDAPRSAESVSDTHLTPLLRRLGIAHAGPHAFRHSFCRSLWAAGIDAESIRRLMRHANLNQTLRYSHVGTHQLRAAMDRLSTSQMGAQ